MIKNIIGRIVQISLLVLVFVCVAKNVVAQTSENALYVPLIGITSVPVPLALPDEGGDVIYKYAVKNFVKEVPLVNIKVVDDKCAPVKFIEGDDDNNLRLDYSETWRYSCTTKLSATTQSTATVTAGANNVEATHRAYVTVVVGSNSPPPLVSIVNITKVAYPLELPSSGGNITFTYKVNNPGIVPLSDVSVADDKCSAMSGKLGDTNGNNLLDVGEVWVYTCTMRLSQTTTNTASVVAYANGLRAVGFATITVTVKNPIPGFQSQSIPNFPETGAPTNFKIITWVILGIVFASLVVLYLFGRRKSVSDREKGHSVSDGHI